MKITNWFPSPLGVLISYSQQVFTFAMKTNLVSVSSRSSYFLFGALFLLCTPCTSFRLLSEFLFLIQINDGVIEDLEAMFPSPLGVLISYSIYFNSLLCNPETFPSPLGVLISYSLGYDVMSLYEVLEFPSPLGVLISYSEY